MKKIDALEKQIQIFWMHIENQEAINQVNNLFLAKTNLKLIGKIFVHGNIYIHIHIETCLFSFKYKSFGLSTEGKIYIYFFFKETVK